MKCYTDTLVFLSPISKEQMFRPCTYTYMDKYVYVHARSIPLEKSLKCPIEANGDVLRCTSTQAASFLGTCVRKQWCTWILVCLHGDIPTYVCTDNYYKGTYVYKCTRRCTATKDINFSTREEQHPKRKRQTNVLYATG